MSKTDFNEVKKLKEALQNELAKSNKPLILYAAVDETGEHEGIVNGTLSDFIKFLMLISSEEEIAAKAILAVATEIKRIQKEFITS